MHSMRSICFVWRSMGVRWGFGPLWQGVWWKRQLSSDLSEFEGREDTCFVGGNEVLGEFDQPCVRVRSLVLLNLFLLDCEGWFLPLPRGHCCERRECGLLSILDSQVHIKHHAKEVLPSSKVLETLSMPWKYIFTFLFGIVFLAIQTQALFVCDQGNHRVQAKEVMKMKHLCTASLHGQIGQDIASLLVFVSLLVLRTYHVTFESSIELVCRSSMHLMAGVPLGFQSLHVTMSHRFRKLTLHSCLCMRQLHSQMGRIQEEKGRLHFTYIDPCLNINEKS